MTNDVKTTWGGGQSIRPIDILRTDSVQDDVRSENERLRETVPTKEQIVAVLKFITERDYNDNGVCLEIYSDGSGLFAHGPSQSKTERFYTFDEAADRLLELAKEKE